MAKRWSKKVELFDEFSDRLTFDPSFESSYLVRERFNNMFLFEKWLSRDIDGSIWKSSFLNRRYLRPRTKSNLFKVIFFLCDPKSNKNSWNLNGKAKFCIKSFVRLRLLIQEKYGERKEISAESLCFRRFCLFMKNVKRELGILKFTTSQQDNLLQIFQKLGFLRKLIDF